MAATQRQFGSNADFYEFVDTIAERLRHNGCVADAERLHMLIHKVAWTTSTELFGDYALRCAKYERSAAQLIPILLQTSGPQSKFSIARFLPVANLVSR